MLRNYLKIGFRNLVGNKLFTLINIGGMAISIASFLIISLFIYDEWLFDKHVKDYDLKYRVYAERFSDDGSVMTAAMIAPIIAPTMASEYPEVESYFRFMNLNDPILFQVGDKKFTEDKGGYADPTVFDMFSLELLEGDMRTALKEPNSIAISETLKKKYFGDNPALGEIIQLNGPVKVSAVYRDFSLHSHFQMNYFLGMQDLESMISDRMQSWLWSQFITYVKLKPGTDASQLDAKLKDFVARNAWEKTKPSGHYYIPHLMPIERIHLYASEHGWDVAVRGNVQTVYILLATAIFILLIAILNFVNLSTARGVSRIKEVGVRKVVGAYRRQLIHQFISESMIIAISALACGILITIFILPLLNSFTEKHIAASVLLSPPLMLGLLFFAGFIGIAAGAYPAFYISGFRPTLLLSKRTGRSGNTMLRKSFVVLQFMLSFFLMIASLTVSQQLHYMRTADMGFDKDNLIVISLRGDMAKQPATTKQTFGNHPGVISATLGYGLPGEAYAGDAIKDKVNNNKEWSVNMLTVDHDYIKTLGLEVIAGRDFSTTFPSDEKHGFIVSETAAKMIGYTDPKEAIGHELAWSRWDAPDTLKEGTVVGVIKDIQLNSMRDNITPVVLQVFPWAYSTLTLRIKTDDVPATVAHLEKSWKTFNADWPFEYKFLDENFDKMYKSEEKLAVLFTFFTGFTILVACMGLLGLVIYSTTQRYKEISIRKVLGAREAGIVMQLAKQYILLLALAFAIAIPVSYYVVVQWLEKFAFHIQVTPILFLQAACLILTLTMITVGVQSLKAARANPVDALSEN